MSQTSSLAQHVDSMMKVRQMRKLGQGPHQGYDLLQLVQASLQYPVAGHHQCLYPVTPRLALQRTRSRQLPHPTRWQKGTLVPEERGQVITGTPLV